MTKWDKDYIKLCKTILKKGKEVPNRTGINTIKIPGYELEFDLEESLFLFLRFILILLFFFISKFLS